MAFHAAELCIVSKVCEPCHYQRQEKASAEYCIQCDESYCLECARRHQTHRISSTHTVRRIGQSYIIRTNCDPCSQEQKESKALFVCKECLESYCNSCHIHHTAQKCSRDHSVVEVNTPEECMLSTLLGEKSECEAPSQEIEFEEGRDTGETEHWNKEQRNVREKEADDFKPSGDSTWGNGPEGNLQTKYNGDENINAENSKDPTLNKSYEKNGEENLEKGEGENNQMKTQFSENFEDGPVDEQKTDDEKLEPHNSVSLWHDTNEGTQGRTDTGQGVRENEISVKSIAKRTDKKDGTNNNNKQFTLPKEQENNFPSENRKSKCGNSPSCKKSQDATKSRQPGKPYADYVQSNIIRMKWMDANEKHSDEVYEVYSKEAREGTWELFNENHHYTENTCNITDLKPSTRYVFKTRLVNPSTGDAGPFSLVSDVIVTKESPAEVYKPRSTLLNKASTPSVYQLPMKEDTRYRDMESRIRRFVIGESVGSLPIKTILLVGEAGTGKSTLVDCFANYSLGVSQDDDFRLTVTLDKGPGASSLDRQRTEWINMYTLFPLKDTEFPYILNIIDTPGLGESGNKGEDERILTGIEILLKKHLEKVDVIGITLRSSDARVTVSQRLIFDSLINLFGLDIAENLCSLITFCDSKVPPVIQVMKSFKKLSCKAFLCFNNCSLFANSEDHRLKMFWKMGKEAFIGLINFIQTTNSKALILSHKQVYVRDKIRVELLHLERLFQKALFELNEIEQTRSLISRQAKDGPTEGNIVSYEKKEIPISWPGRNAMTCMRCYQTCHEDCEFQSKDKYLCVAFKRNGFCLFCSRQCHMYEHELKPFIIQWVPKHKIFDPTTSQHVETTEQKLQTLDKKKQQIEKDIIILLCGISDKMDSYEKYSLHPSKLTIHQNLDQMIKVRERALGCSFPTQILLNLKQSIKNCDLQQVTVSKELESVLKRLSEMNI